MSCPRISQSRWFWTKSSCETCCLYSHEKWMVMFSLRMVDRFGPSWGVRLTLAHTALLPYRRLNFHFPSPRFCPEVPPAGTWSELMAPNVSRSVWGQWKQNPPHPHIEVHYRTAWGQHSCVPDSWVSGTMKPRKMGVWEGVPRTTRSKSYECVC